MNTLEARERLLDLSWQALAIVDSLAAGNVAGGEERVRMREVLRAAREVVYDAGYPGEEAWRAILHVSVYVNAPPEEATIDLWEEAAQGLRAAAEPLELVTDLSHGR